MCNVVEPLLGFLVGTFLLGKPRPLSPQSHCECTGEPLPLLSLDSWTHESESGYRRADSCLAYTAAFKAELDPFRRLSPRSITTESSTSHFRSIQLLLRGEGLVKPVSYMSTSPWPDFTGCEMRFFHYKYYVECHAGREGILPVHGWLCWEEHYGLELQIQVQKALLLTGFAGEHWN